VLERAIALDPDYSDAYAALGMLYNFDFQNRWSDDPDGSRARALKYSEIAAAKEPDSPFAHLALAIASSFVRDLDRAGREAGEALRLSPNYAMALNARGTIEIFRGNPGKALPDIELARRLDPSFSHQYVHFLGVAHFALGHYETAVAHFRERIALAPETDLSRGYLIAALGHLGRPEEAARVWAELKAINPRYSFAAHIGRLPFRRAEDIARLEEGFARAGIGP
jgi:adenylate cyclase